MGVAEDGRAEGVGDLGVFGGVGEGGGDEGEEALGVGVGETGSRGETAATTSQKATSDSTVPSVPREPKAAGVALRRSWT